MKLEKAYIELDKAMEIVMGGYKWLSRLEATLKIEEIEEFIQKQAHMMKVLGQQALVLDILSSDANFYFQLSTPYFYENNKEFDKSVIIGTNTKVLDNGIICQTILVQLIGVDIDVRSIDSLTLSTDRLRVYSNKPGRQLDRFEQPTVRAKISQLSDVAKNQIPVTIQSDKVKVRHKIILGPDILADTDGEDITLRIMSASPAEIEL